MKEFVYKTKIQENQLDVFGHVNNARYLEIFESARWDILEDSGIGLSHIQKTKIGPVILEANIKYKKELKGRDLITIVSTCKITEKHAILRIDQQIIKEDGKIAAEAVFTLGMMNLESRKLVAPPVEWAKAFELVPIP